MGYMELLDVTGRVNDLLNSANILNWDSRTMMPRAGGATRGQQVATLSVAARDLLCSDETLRALERAEAETQKLPEDDVKRVMTRHVREAVEYHDSIPTSVLRRREELAGIAHDLWADARSASDFSIFAPVLSQMIDVNRELAAEIRIGDHPYEALLHKLEPGTRLPDLDKLFARLRDGILPLVRAIGERKQPRSDFLYRHYPEQAQLAFSLKMAKRIGFDTDRGRFDTTVHPFEVSFTRNDVRITTRVSENYMPKCLFGTLHEAGHAMYEQGIDPAYTRTPLATDLIGLYAVGGVSFGAHESQSRLWENQVGRSREFWANHFGEARQAFPDQLADVTEDEFFRAINRSMPSFIRVEANELTYDLHIMLRTDLERQLIDGSLEVKDLPEAWNAIVKEYLGIDVPNDAQGVLQDVHWSSGQIGFCNYTIGNVMAAQLFETAQNEEPGIRKGLEAADYKPLRDWLNDKVCRHGRRYSRDEILVNATGRALDPEPYISYLTGKYTEVYGL